MKALKLFISIFLLSFMIPFISSCGDEPESGDDTYKSITINNETWYYNTHNSNVCYTYYSTTGWGDYMNCFVTKQKKSDGSSDYISFQLHFKELNNNIELTKLSKGSRLVLESANTLAHSDAYVSTLYNYTNYESITYNGYDKTRNKILLTVRNLKYTNPTTGKSIIITGDLECRYEKY